MTYDLIAISILVIVGIISLVFGIRFLIKYRTERKKYYLIWGIILTFVIPAILFFVAFKVFISDMMITYGPDPNINYGPNPVIAYGPSPV